MHGYKLRWLTAREKLAISGLAVSQLQAEKAGIKVPVNWGVDVNWHERVGNGNRLQNVGLVLLSTLANLRIKPKAPLNVLSIEPPSQPDGLSVVDGKYMLKIGEKTFPIGKNKEVAYQLHKQVHETWQFDEFRSKKALGILVGWLLGWLVGGLAGWLSWLVI